MKITNKSKSDQKIPDISIRSAKDHLRGSLIDCLATVKSIPPGQDLKDLLDDFYVIFVDDYYLNTRQEISNLGFKYETAKSQLDTDKFAELNTMLEIARIADNFTDKILSQ